MLSLALIGALSGCDRLQQLRDYFSSSSSSQAPVAIPGQGGQVNMLLPDFTQLVEREGPGSGQYQRQPNWKTKKTRPSPS